MKTLLFKPTFWLGSLVIAIMSNVQLPSLGNFTSSMAIDSPKSLLFTQTVIEQVIAQGKQAQNSTVQIPNGRYIGEAPSDAIIEIRNKEYCGLGFVDCSPISDLKYIKPGVVQLGNNPNGYFCSEKLFKINSSGECTAKGWIKR
jgi:hypothetical protein